MFYLLKPNRSHRKRFFVPDLTPNDRDVQWKVRVAFIAESPHANEVEPENIKDRRPLCGLAGKKWWKLLRSIVDDANQSPDGVNDSVDLESLFSFCYKNGIAVLNAVQYPLDPKITKPYPDADPITQLGFAKTTGQHSYKKALKDEIMKEAMSSLRIRVEKLGSDCKVYCLGNDSLWLTQKALDEKSSLIKGKIPHPAAWWRRGGYFGDVAKEELNRIF